MTSRQHRARIRALAAAAALLTGLTVATGLTAGAANATTGAAASQPDARAATAPGAALTDAQIAALTPQAQATLLTPLRTTANALGTVGRSGPLAGVYGNLRIDAGHDRVLLYLTDVHQGPRFLAAAHAVDPAADLRLVEVHPAAASHQTLDAAARKVVALADAHRLPYAIGMVGPAPDAAGLQVDVPAATAAQLSARPAAAAAADPLTALGVPVVHQTVPDLVPEAWADVKWHDSSPFIGGDAITGSGSGHGCTAGLPAVRKSDNHPIMITAAHCFGVGTRVYTRAGTPGSYSNGLLGNYVGTVTDRDTSWDAETIDGANNNADESDTTGWLPLTSFAYSYNGDYVCHDGQRSYFMGHPTPCNIKVTNQDMYCGPTTGCPGLSYTARGVWGDAVNDGWGAAGGDSGATIFAVESGGVRQARGLLSDGTPGDGTPGVFWTEATDIFGHWGLTLNPTT